MELWIRSQDKEKLVRIKALKLTSLGSRKYEISGLLIGFEYLGTYKTKERALEVLDEIQDFIEKQCMKHISSSGMYYEKYVVYEMPSE